MLIHPYLKKAEEEHPVYKINNYMVLRLRFLIEELSDELDENGDHIPWSGYSIFDFVVVDNNDNLVEFPQAKPILDSYFEILQNRIDQYDQLHPEQAIGYPESLYYVYEDTAI